MPRTLQKSFWWWVGNTVNIVFCFGPRLGLKTEVWAQAEQKDSHYKGNQMNSSVIYFDILIISTSDCDEKVRTLIDNWKLCTKKKINLKKQMQLALFSQVF